VVFSLAKLRFKREIQAFGVVSILCLSAQAAVEVWKGRRDVTVEPGDIAQNVGSLGGPCEALVQFAYGKYHYAFGIGQCRVRYKNAENDHAIVKLEMFRESQSATLYAEAVSDGGPLASLNWRILRSAKTPWYGPGTT
jgi:hypothetical protein